MKKFLFIAILLSGTLLASCEASFTPPSDSGNNTPPAPSWFYLAKTSNLHLSGDAFLSGAPSFPTYMRVIIAWEIPHTQKLYVFGEGAVDPKERSIDVGHGNYTYAHRFTLNISDTLPKDAILQTADSVNAFAVAHILFCTRLDVAAGTIMDYNSGWDTLDIFGAADHVIGFTKGDPKKLSVPFNVAPGPPALNLFDERMGLNLDLKDTDKLFIGIEVNLRDIHDGINFSLFP